MALDWSILATMEQRFPSERTSDHEELNLPRAIGKKRLQLLASY